MCENREIPVRPSPFQVGVIKTASGWKPLIRSSYKDKLCSQEEAMKLYLADLKKYNEVHGTQMEPQEENHS